MTAADRKRIEEIETRLTARTPGEWYAGTAVGALHRRGCDGDCVNLWTDGEAYGRTDGRTDITAPCSGLRWDDARLCAYAPADLDFLLALARDQAQLIHDLREESAAYAAGYRDGAEEMQGRAAGAAERCLENLGHEGLAWRAEDAVRGLPVTPPAGQG